MKRTLYFLVLLVLCFTAENYATNADIREQFASQYESNIDKALIGWAIDGNIQGVQWALKSGANPDASFHSPLILASANGHYSVCRILLNAGADVNGRNIYEQTALMAAAAGGHTGICKLLLEAGAEPEKKDRYGWTPLVYAQSYGHDIIASMLMSDDGEIPSYNPEDTLADSIIVSIIAITILTIALIIALVIILMMRSKMNAVSYGAQTINIEEIAAQIAGRNSNPANGKVDPDVFKQVRKLDARDSKGRTALMRAVILDNPEEAKKIAAFGANVHTKDKNGATALFMAIEKGDAKSALMLLKAGADANAKDKTKTSALVMSIKNGNAECTKILLDNGADANQKISPNKTVLKFAEENGLTEIAELLREHDAK